MINNILIKEFGLKIKSLRNEKKLSQEELSFITGFHRTYIGMIERGERNISLSNIAVFSKALEVEIHDLLNFKESSSQISFKDFETKNGQ